MKSGKAAQRASGSENLNVSIKRQEDFCQSAHPGTLCAYLFIHSFTEAELLRPVCQGATLEARGAGQSHHITRGEKKQLE